MRSSVYLWLYNFSTAILYSYPALEINLTNWERQCWCISLGIRVASSIKMPLCFSHGQWRNGSWKMRKYLGIWLQIWVPCHVCGLAQFFGLGNRLIIAMLDGFQNVILCFHPNRSPGNTTVCPLFLVGLKPWHHLSSRQIRVYPNRTSCVFQKSVSFAGFSVWGNVHSFLLVSGFL